MRHKNKISVAEYLYFLSVKYKVDFDKLFRGLVSAAENHEVPCGKLLIECRKKGKDHDTFLITNDRAVVAQFFVPKHFLDQPNRIEELQHSHLFARVSKPYENDKPSLIRDLKCGMKQVNLKARVLDVPKAVSVFTRFGEYARVSNALIADETGAVKLCLWNEAIDMISVDCVVQVENASVAKFRGETQLRLGKKGKLSVVENADFPSKNDVRRILVKAPLTLRQNA